MSLYERINKKEKVVPDCFDMSIKQAFDLANETGSRIDAIYTAFKFGYMQGVRAERKGKAGNIE